MQVKDNQGYLLFDCVRNAKGGRESDLHVQREKRKRNRKELRVTKTFHDPVFLVKEKWKGIIPMMIQVIRKTQSLNTKEKSWKTSIEISYYVCTKTLSAKEAAKVIREHWSIENRNHYVRDVSMNEDSSRIRKNPQIMAKLRSTALNILRKTDCSNIKSQLYSNALNLELTIERYRHFLL